jgi:SAM-dependent methyltransferase
MRAMTAGDFERRYRAYGDPWGYRSSSYERAKYAATLQACGPGPFEAALELGGSIGVFSARLAPRCRSLTTLDFSPTATRAARAELAAYPHVRVLDGAIPEALPDGGFDLVVASEILYYLDAGAFAATLKAIERGLTPGGRLVCVHWCTPGPERPLTAEQVHAQVRAQPWLHWVRSEATAEYLLDVLERR